MRGDDIEERMLEFAVRVVRMTEALPKTATAKHICLQVVRSGTSAGANYEEARGAESNNDFVHKLGLSLKELRETRYWLKVISKANLIPSVRMTEILQESDELCRIVGKSIVTSKKNGCD
jgi:four helix bundle protein